MTIQADLQNGANWQLTYYRSEAVTFDAAGGYSALPVFDIPIVFNERILMVRATSTNARFTWRFMGILSQRINIFGNQLDLEPALFQANLRINRSRILIFDQVETPYELFFEPFYWLKQCDLYVYTFIGQIS